VHLFDAGTVVVMVDVDAEGVEGLFGSVHALSRHSSEDWNPAFVIGKFQYTNHAKANSIFQ